MKFKNFLLRVDGEREAKIEDFLEIEEKGRRIYKPERQKYLYCIDMEILENRFLWMECEYADANKFREYVVNSETGEREPNPRTKDQIEPRQQLFVCYDCETHYLYLNDITRRHFLEEYFGEMTQKDYVINNVYASVDEFCERIKAIRGFQYTQVNNLFAHQGDLFDRVGNIWGQDCPSKVQLKIGYDDVPVHEGGRGIIDRISRHKEEFESVIIIGCDDEGVEQTFDFSSILKHLIIYPYKDENENYDPHQIKTLLLDKLR